MNKHFKIRKLIAESLEQRQLFAADLLIDVETWTSNSESRPHAEFGQYGRQAHDLIDFSTDSDNFVDHSSVSADSISGSGLSGLSIIRQGLVLSFRQNFVGHHGNERLTPEGEDFRSPSPSKTVENFGGSNSGPRVVSSSALGSGSLGMGSNAGTNEVSQSPLVPQNTGQSVGTTTQSIDKGGRISPSTPNLSQNSNSTSSFSSIQSSLSLNSANQNGSSAKPDSVGSSNTGPTSIILVFRSNETPSITNQPRLSNSSSPSNSLTQQFTPSSNGATNRLTEAGFNSSTQDRNNNPVVQSIQQQHASNVRSLQGYLNGSMDAQNLLRSSNQNYASNNLTPHTPSLTDQSMSGLLNREASSESIVRMNSSSTNSEVVLEDDLLGGASLGSQLGLTNRPWKISESSLNHLRKLSKSSEHATVDSASSYDLVIAGMFEEGGFSEIEFRKNPITRVEQPWNMVQVAARLESKVGAFRVFDVIDEDADPKVSLTERMTGQVSSADVLVDVAIPESVAAKSAIEETEDKSHTTINKPLFLATVLAVVSGRFLRSRRKHSEKHLLSAKN